MLPFNSSIFLLHFGTMRAPEDFSQLGYANDYLSWICIRIQSRFSLDIVGECMLRQVATCLGSDGA